jgi:predicted AlkP superfamily phosphohydrolase/phosphomutase
MTSRKPVIVVGLDACDPSIARQLAAQGQLPTLRRLFEKAAACPVRNPPGLFVGALWTSFATGLRADRHGFHCWDEIDVATYQRRLTEPPHVENTFWRQLSDAGRRIAVFDVPHAKVTRPVNGIEVFEWGCHDRHFGLHSWPPKTATDIDAAFGLHPILGMDGYARREFAPDDYACRSGRLRTREEDKALFDGLIQGIRTKRLIMREMLGSGASDLVISVLGESHCIGHQQWHLHDPSHPRYDPAVVEAVGGDPVSAIYRELDRSLGEILRHAGDGATVLVMLSHGMGPHYDGCHLLDEILTRLDAVDRDPPQRVRSAFKRALSLLPGRAQQRLTAFAVPAMRVRLRRRPPPACAEYAEPEARARQSFFLEPNNYVYGGIRLNIAGREPNGIVGPHEVEGVIRRVTEGLLAFVNVRTGGPVVRDVFRSERWYRRSGDDTLPDLFVDWARDAQIEAVWSPKAGLVHAPYTHWRTGDHRLHGLLLAYGPGIGGGATLDPIDVEDIAPGIAARFGVDLGDVDGRAPAWLAA